MGKPSPIEVQKALKGETYPADRESLTRTAKRNGASDEMVDKISHLKQKRFDGPNEVEKAIFD
ncbi:DUF2795 domain-containing protein [Streptomyces sp. 7-21]|uniref:DUF2795 domain-containing protein n=1 Tax=Streptomyces sp. 7-21 TaxID=2802283 RepID=UPI00191CAED3|nr:DUF2795 domain-containing protein [Streptomyces sp. 7-21]MBL1068822.1 DUF2795 domain-containing protein [Streptomyces sp. 7-21]